MSKVLYLCPDFPGSSSTGGSHAHRYFIDEFRRVYGQSMVLIGVGAEAVTGNELHVVARPTRKGWRAILWKTWRQLARPWQPNKVTCRFSQDARRIAAELLVGGDVSMVVVDHLDALALVDIIQLRRTGVPVIYIAHNIEADLVADLAKLALGHPLKYWMLRFEGCRTKRLEVELIRLASRVIFLSSYDEARAQEMCGDKTTCSRIPAFPSPGVVRIRSNDQKTKILYSCNFNFPPNVNALEWIAIELAPLLEIIVPDVEIIVTGVDDCRVPQLWRRKNIAYIGFLSAEAFLDVLKNADAFICPIMYGSGIKMKIVEALNWGLPVFAPSSAWRGLESVAAGFVMPNDPREAALQIKDAVNSKVRLTAMADEMGGRYRGLLAGRPDFSSLVPSLGRLAAELEKV